jgi:CRISPR-associated endonuclease Cas2
VALFSLETIGLVSTCQVCPHNRLTGQKEYWCIQMSYLICYDLDKPGQDYTDVIAALEELGAKRIQYSVWLLYAPALSAIQIRDHLAQFIDGNDRLLVVGLQNVAAWQHLMIPHQTVQQILAA